MVYNDALFIIDPPREKRKPRWSWRKAFGLTPPDPVKKKHGEIAPGVPDPLYVMIDMIISHIQRNPEKVGNREYVGMDLPAGISEDNPDAYRYAKNRYSATFEIDNPSIKIVLAFINTSSNRDIWDKSKSKVIVNKKSFTGLEEWMLDRLSAAFKEARQMNEKIKENKELSAKRQKACDLITELCGVEETAAP